MPHLTRLAFEAGGYDAPDEEPLEDEEDDDHRNDDQHRHRHHIVVIDGVLTTKTIDSDGQGMQIGIAQVNQRRQEVIPVADEGEYSDGC